MDEQEMKAWRYHNETLQYYYQKYQCSNTTKERDFALKEIQRAIEWEPFTDYISRNPLASPWGIARYGLDSVTERCINEINEIAKGELIYIP